ncbi:Predicted helicase [Klebsiella pneumoniae]|nr:Predicted helicase [Klebsiella pneumoniae]
MRPYLKDFMIHTSVPYVGPSDRIGDRGVIGYVTNAGFIEANTADGMRKCLAKSFPTSGFSLRGNQRTQGELSRKEGGKIFGSGSRAPIAITLLVKNPDAKEYGQIYFHDIGDYLSRDEKLLKISELSDISGITEANGWVHIVPNIHGDWLNQRDDSFNEFIAMGDKKVAIRNYLITSLWAYQPIEMLGVGIPASTNWQQIWVQ